jgi:putative oligomerization/nucleic acid binding protein/phospholipase D-like protein
MVIGADYPLANIIWTMLVFFGFVIWIWTLFMVFADLFSRHDIGGWAKAGWTLFVIVLPLLGVLVYLIAEGKGMAQRRAKDIETSQAQLDQHIRTVAGGPAGEINQAKQLLDSGAITPQEFEQLKARALAGESAAPSTPSYAG